MSKYILIYSGGMDSYTLLHDLLARGHDVFPVSFHYGQRHSKELQYAESVCAELGLPHHAIDLRIVKPLLQGSSLTSDIPVPEGHYEEESMKQTVVPNRNMIMLSIAIGYAVSVDADFVAFGAHGGDHAIYPDCRSEFVAAMDSVATIANWHPVSVVAPYIALSKGDIAAIGKSLGLDYSKAWTCYNGREKACGKCGACQERKEAMEFAEVTDATEYEA